MTEKAFTLRSLIIGLAFGSLVAVANAFLMLTIPVMVTAAMISVVALFAFSSLFKADPPSSKEAVTAYTTHQAAAFAFSIFPIMWVFFVSYDIPRRLRLDIPSWILPDSTVYNDVLRDGVIFSRSWISPLAWIIPVGVVSGIAALVIVIWLRDHLICKENLTFPEAQADIQMIKSLSTEKYRLDYLFYGLIAGFFFDFLLIHYPTSLGAAPDWLRQVSVKIGLLDLTPYIAKVLPGATFCIVISLGLLGLGILMSPKTTFNMVGSAVLFYMALSAILVSRGTIQASDSFISQWSVFRYPYGMSLSIGILITAALAPVILRIASPLISGSKWKWKLPRNTLYVFVIFCVAVLVLFTVLSLDRFVTVFPLSTPEALLAGGIVLALFVVGVLINTRIASESGTLWMSQLADTTAYARQSALLGFGTLGFEGFAISESLHGTRFAAGQINALKVGKAFEATPRHQYISALFGWSFGWLIVTPFVFLLWHFYGVGRGALPMPNLQAIATTMIGFASGRMESVFNNWFILIGFIIGIIVFLLEKRNLPFVVVAFGIGVFVGPIYVTTFFVGGLIRVLIEKTRGVSWMDEKGKPFSAGLVLGGLALAPLMMVVVNVLIVFFGGG